MFLFLFCFVFIFWHLRSNMIYYLPFHFTVNKMYNYLGRTSESALDGLTGVSKK